MKRVVITGVGVTSSIGSTVKKFSSSLKELVSGIGEFDTFNNEAYPVRIGATVKDEPTAPHLKKLPRPVQHLMNAATEALESSGVLNSVAPERIGSYLAGPACSLFELESFYRKYLKRGQTPEDVKDFLYITWDGATNYVSNKFNLMGPRNTFLTACSSSGVAAGLAFDLIRLGDADAMVVGGADGFSEMTFSGFNALQSISPFPCRPFDKNRAGISFGEGAGVLILEDYESAKKRGAPILAEMFGYGAIGEAYNLTAPRPDALGFVHTMTRALETAKVNLDQVTYINAHGTATPLNDLIEGQAIQKVFGDRNMPVNSIKSLVGHCMGAAGAVESVNCVLSIAENFIPGTKNCTEVDEATGANVVRETRDDKVDYILCNSAGFGGNNTSVLFGSVAP